jgi:acetyl-CoA carboxylase biotin carboxyl carrier protein
VDIEKLRQIIDLLKEEGLSEITVWEGEDRITVCQVPAGFWAGLPAHDRAVVEGDRRAEADRTFPLTAPLVGTFYRRPTPEDEPFVAEGNVVEAGDTVCIIEAMKVMNEIKAEAPGRLRRIMAEDGAPVEYGQALFIFERT